VILETAEDQRQFETDLAKVFVRGRSTNQLIPLSSLASFKRTIGPTAVNHQGQIPAVTLSFNLAPDVPLGDATDKIEKYVKDIQLPPSIITSYGGDAKVFKGNQGGQFILIIASLLVIYILLGVLYESYIHPITILAGLPSAAIGALLSLWMFGMELTIIATIGILMLIGIVKKNAILMIDFALDAQRNQKNESYRGNSFGMYSAFQTDHDDYLDSYRRRPTHCPWLRCWCRVTATSRGKRRWWINPLSICYSVYYTGHLSLS